MADISGKLTTMNRGKHFLKYHWRGLILFLTPIIYTPLLLFEPVKPFRWFYIFCVMMTYFYSEATSRYIPALLPIVLFPIMGIMSTRVTCQQYLCNYTVSYVISMILNFAIEYNNLHRRIAINILALVGYRIRLIHFGLMFITASISTMVDKELTAGIMCTFTKAFLLYYEELGATEIYSDKKLSGENSLPYPTKLTRSYYLGVAYASIIGCCLSFLGSDTIAIFRDNYTKRYAVNGRQEIEYKDLTLFNLVPALIIFILTYIWLEMAYMGLFRAKSKAAEDIKIDNELKKNARKFFQQKRKELGRLKLAEILIFIYVVLLMVSFVVLDVFRFSIITTKDESIKRKLIASKMAECTLCVFILVLLFITPGSWNFCSYFTCRKPKEYGEAKPMVPWTYAHKNMHWETFFMFGGFGALIIAFSSVGLPALIAENFLFKIKLPSSMMIFCASAIGMILSVFSMTYLTASFFIPLLFEFAIRNRISALRASLPAVLCINLCFVSPLTTAAIAIPADYGNIRVKDTFFAGLVPTIISVIVYPLYFIWMGPRFYNLDLPGWAKTELAIMPSAFHNHQLNN